MSRSEFLSAKSSPAITKLGLFHLHHSRGFPPQNVHLTRGTKPSKALLCPTHRRTKLRPATPWRCSTQHQQQKRSYVNEQLWLLGAQHPVGHGLLRLPLRLLSFASRRHQATSGASAMEIHKRIFGPAFRGSEDSPASTCRIQEERRKGCACGRVAKTARYI